MSKSIKAQKASVRNQEKAIKRIIERYGNTIDLRKAPYLIVEIIREYGPLFLGGGKPFQSGPVPGSHGTPPPPPPPESMPDLRRTVAELVRRVERLEKLK